MFWVGGGGGGYNRNLDQLSWLPAHRLAYEIIGFQKIAAKGPANSS